MAALAVFIAVEGASAAETVLVKSTDESVAGSTALQDDDELTFTSAAATPYVVEGTLIYSSPAGDGVPDLKMGFGEDGTNRGTTTWSGLGTSNTFQSSGLVVNTGVSGSMGTATATRTVYFLGTFVGNGGTARVRWAQNTSDPANLTVHAGSVLRYRTLDHAPTSGATDLDGLTDVDTTGAIDGVILKYDEDTSTWGVATDATGEGSGSGPVTLSDGDRARLDLAWWGTWALVGLLLVLMIAPPMLSVMRVTRGMGA